MAAINCAEVIAQLKQIRAERGLSFQRIVELVEESGGSISISTVRKIFSDGSEDRLYRYEDTIKPLVIALLDFNKSAGAAEGSPSPHEMDALREVVLLKEQINQTLQAEIQRLLEDSDRKHAHIVALTEQNKSKDQMIYRLAAGMITLFALICAVLLYDIANLNTGYVRVFSGAAALAAVVIAAALAGIVLIVKKIFKRAR